MLLQRLLDVVRKWPEKECIVDGARRVTYGELGTKIEVVAATLRDRIEAGDRVAVLADASAEYAAACYGAWWAGGVVVGLNTALRTPDLIRLIEHCSASCLITLEGEQRLPEIRSALRDVSCIELSADVPESPSTLDEPARREPEHLAALLYTSGTTGHPKGVMLTHRNFSANTESICRYLAIRESDRAACVLPFFYSYGSSVLHTHLVTGATLVLERSLQYPHRLLEMMVEERATSFAGVPSTFYLLLRRADLSAYDLSALRYVTQAGGRMEPDKIEAFQAAVPGTDFVVMYGQTEATARLAHVPPAELATKPGSAGKAIPGVELCVKDETGRELAAGEVGEVCARGENVMAGYWNDPEETAKVLRDGWLHTGDLGYLDEDGFLFLSGRSREMIKSGAHRISAAEIEEVVREVDGVQDAAVVGAPDEILGQAVKAVVIARDPGDDLARKIKRTCRDRLPAFKVPKLVEFRTEFPRTASGKVRKHLL